MRTWSRAVSSLQSSSTSSPCNMVSSAQQLLPSQLAGFAVNVDTRQQVQKLQQEVMQCTHELSTLQDHLRTGFAEVKEKIDDSQDRCPPFHVTAKVSESPTTANCHDNSTLCLVSAAAHKVQPELAGYIPRPLLWSRCLQLQWHCWHNNVSTVCQLVPLQQSLTGKSACWPLTRARLLPLHSTGCEALFAGVRK